MISILLEIPVAPIVPFVRSCRFLLGCSHARSPNSRCASRHRVLRSSFFSAHPLFLRHSACPCSFSLAFLTFLHRHSSSLSLLSSSTPRLFHLFRPASITFFFVLGNSSEFPSRCRCSLKFRIPQSVYAISVIRRHECFL